MTPAEALYMAMSVLPNVLDFYADELDERAAAHLRNVVAAARSAWRELPADEKIAAVDLYMQSEEAAR